MSLAIVTFSYVMVVILALGLLYVFGAVRWYWHALAAGVALVLGSMPMSAFRPWGSPLFELMLGSTIIFLLVWGIAAPFFRRYHLPLRHH